MSERERVVPMIHVPDVRATVDWYQAIGFTVNHTYGDGGGGLSFAIVSFGRGEVMFSSGGRPSTSDRREVDLYVYADNVDELYERHKDRVEIVEGLHNTFYGSREFIIRDLNRVWVTFGQDLPAVSVDDLELRLQRQVNRLQPLLPPATNTACQEVAAKLHERLPLLLVAEDWEENLLREIRRELAIHQNDIPDIQDAPPAGPIIAAVFSTVAAIIVLIGTLTEKANEDREQVRVKELEAMKVKLMSSVNMWVPWVERQEGEEFMSVPITNQLIRDD